MYGISINTLATRCLTIFPNLLSTKDTSRDQNIHQHHQNGNERAYKITNPAHTVLTMALDFLSAANPKQAITRKARELKLQRPCLCGNGLECRKFQILYTLNGDEDYGAKCLHLTIVDDASSEKSQKWRAALACHLQFDATEVYASLTGDRLTVARHHFHRQQIKYITGTTPPGEGDNKIKRASKPLTAEEIIAIDGEIDERFSIGPTPKDNVVRYFNLPSRSMDLVRSDATAIITTLTAEGANGITPLDRVERAAAQREADFHANMTVAQYEAGEAIWKQRERDLLISIAKLTEAKRKKETQLEDSRKKYKSAMRHKRKRKAEEVDELPPIEQELVMEYNHQFIVETGGLTRVTLFNSRWHALNEGAAGALFGYKTYDDLKARVKAKFPDVDVDYIPRACLVQEGRKHRLCVLPTFLTEFEQCVAARLFMHSIPNKSRIATIFGRKHSGMSSSIRKWVPRWQNAGGGKSSTSAKKPPAVAAAVAESPTTATARNAPEQAFAAV